MVKFRSVWPVLKHAGDSLTRKAVSRQRVAPGPSESRPYLVNYHIFKNAGSSMDHLLDAHFGKGFGQYETALPFQAVDPEGFGAFLAERPGLRAISSHLPRRFLLHPYCLPLVMLRHPIDRARSVYQFIRRDATAKDHSIACRGFAAYVDWALATPGEGISIRNYQVFHLSGLPLLDDNPLLISTSDDLAQAREQIAAWPAFGLVRDFARSCQLFQQQYGATFPGLRFYDLRANVSPNSIPSEAQAIAATRDELGSEIFARLCAANELDDELYRYAQKLFVALTLRFD